MGSSVVTFRDNNSNIASESTSRYADDIDNISNMTISCGASNLIDSSSWGREKISRSKNNSDDSTLKRCRE